jgi:phage terminase large subunit-like protein
MSAPVVEDRTAHVTGRRSSRRRRSNPAPEYAGLSNTATPRYYGMFRDAVLEGRIPVNREVSMEMNRIDLLIANPNIWYDEEAVEGWIRFCENELTLTDGTDLHLLPTFKLWGEQIFGWYYFVERSVYEPSPDGHGGHYVLRTIKKRLTTKQYLIVARGAAKSMYAECIQAYFLNVDTSTTHQITTAPTMKQAEEVMGPFRTAITRARGPLFKFLTEGSMQNTTGNRMMRQKLAATKKGIENFLTGSLLEIRPMSITKLQGLRPKVSTIDEWLSGDIREDVVGAIEQGASKLDDYLIVAISSEGTVRNGSGDTIKMELADILKGEYLAPHVSIWHYKLDDLEEVADPSTWLKANPNLGSTITYETYQLDVERAEKAPAARNDILAKRFGIPMEGYTYFFTYEETLKHRPQKFWELPCAMGADLSQGDDFCAFTFFFPLNRGRFGIKTRSYITSLTLQKLPGAMRQKYEEFIKEGSLRIMEGNILDMMEVYEDLDAYIEQNAYDVRALGFDPYNAKEFVERWSAENGPYGIEKVAQGARTESVPLGELKILAEERLLIFDQELMTFTMGNAITLTDTNGNRKLYKGRREDKIDNVAALMDAYIAWKANREAFE